MRKWVPVSEKIMLKRNKACAHASVSTSQILAAIVPARDREHRAIAGGRPARDLALHHDGALGTRTSGGEGDAVDVLLLGGLQHCHADLVHRHADQGCRDLGLLLRIVAEPTGREDRILERRRLLAHPAGAILGIPGLAHDGALLPFFFRYEGLSCCSATILMVRRTESKPPATVCG